MAGETPWQTTGPFFHFGLCWRGGADLTADSELGARPDLTAEGHDLLVRHGKTNRHLARGEKIEIAGNMFDNADTPFTDALIEIWQANATGHYASSPDRRGTRNEDPNFLGFARAATDRAGRFHFRTIRPGCVPGPGNTLQAPHIALGIVGPGILQRLVTRVYFAGTKENVDDPILQLVPERRRHTLIATPDAAQPHLYRFDIRLGGPNETVFFEF